MPDENKIEIKEAVRLIWLAKSGQLDVDTFRKAVGDSQAQSMTELAYGFNVTAATVRHTWKQNGLPSVGKRGSGSKAKWADVFAWLVSRDEHNAAARGADEFTERKRAAETRAAEADALLKERRAQVSAGYWIQLAIAVSYTKAAASVLRDGLMRISQKLRPSYPPKFRDQMCDDLDNEIRNLLVAFSEGSTSDLRAAAEMGGIDDVCG